MNVLLYTVLESHLMLENNSLELPLSSVVTCAEKYLEMYCTYTYLHTSYVFIVLVYIFLEIVRYALRYACVAGKPESIIFSIWKDGVLNNGCNISLSLSWDRVAESKAWTEEITLQNTIMKPRNCWL